MEQVHFELAIQESAAAPDLVPAAASSAAPVEAATGAGYGRGVILENPGGQRLVELLLRGNSGEEHARLAAWAKRDEDEKVVFVLPAGIGGTSVEILGRHMGQ